MSRAFVSDDAAESAPVIPPRPDLPQGVPNYVTPTGLRALRQERETLDAQKAAVASKRKLGESDRRRETTILNGRITQLQQRIASARVVDPAKMDLPEIRFGATVTIQTEDGEERTLQIVGVDEAHNRTDMIAFVAPMARALIGAKTGDTVPMRTPDGEEALTITCVVYE